MAAVKARVDGVGGPGLKPSMHHTGMLLGPHQIANTPGNTKPPGKNVAWTRQKLLASPVEGITAVSGTTPRVSLPMQYSKSCLKVQGDVVSCPTQTVGTCRHWHKTQWKNQAGKTKPHLKRPHSQNSKTRAASCGYQLPACQTKTFMTARQCPGCPSWGDKASTMLYCNKKVQPVN